MQNDLCPFYVYILKFNEEVHKLNTCNIVDRKKTATISRPKYDLAVVLKCTV